MERSDLGTTPKPTPITVQIENGEVKLVYDRSAMTDAHTSKMYSAGLSYWLSCVLLGWDTTDKGEPWQPPDLADSVHWDGVIRAAREQGA